MESTVDGETRWVHFECTVRDEAGAVHAMRRETQWTMGIDGEPVMVGGPEPEIDQVGPPLLPSLLQDGDNVVFVLRKQPAPMVIHMNGEPWWYQAAEGAPLERFLGPSTFEWLEATGQLYG